MSFPLPPIPQNPVANTFEWREWLYKVSTALKEVVQPLFMNLDFTGSTITAIRTRHHGDLQELQGGQGGEQYHMTKALWTQVSGFFNYGSFSNNANQTLGAANTATTLVFNTTDMAVNCSLATNAVTVSSTGIYNIQFSIQLANSSTSIETFWAWLRKNGVDLAGTASKFDVNAKHGTSDGYLIAVANFFVSLSAGDVISMAVASTNTTVVIEAYAAQTTPFAMPSDPSAVITITQVA